jgi:hypothetical protein
MTPTIIVSDDLWIAQNPRLTFDGVRSRDWFEAKGDANPLGWDECSLSVESEWERN